MGNSGDRAKPASLTRKFAAEAVGTFVLVLVAAGGDAVDALAGGEIGHVARYLAPGLAVTALIYTLSGISGAHINPAVTFAFVLRGSFRARDALPYWIAQLSGALAAAATLGAFVGRALERAVNGPHLGLGAFRAMLWETVITAILVFVILGTAEEKAVVGKNAALAVGFTVALCGLFSSPLTGASMNPARSLGPAIVTGSLGAAWVYVVGPLLGAALACAVVLAIHGPPKSPEREVAQGQS